MFEHLDDRKPPDPPALPAVQQRARGLRRRRYAAGAVTVAAAVAATAGGLAALADNDDLRVATDETTTSVAPATSSTTTTTVEAVTGRRVELTLVPESDTVVTGGTLRGLVVVESSLDEPIELADEKGCGADWEAVLARPGEGRWVFGGCEPPLVIEPGTQSWPFEVSASEPGEYELTLHFFDDWDLLDDWDLVLPDPVPIHVVAPEPVPTTPATTVPDTTTTAATPTTTTSTSVPAGVVHFTLVPDATSVTAGGEFRGVVTVGNRHPEAIEVATPGGCDPKWAVLLARADGTLVTFFQTNECRPPLVIPPGSQSWSFSRPATYGGCTNDAGSVSPDIPACPPGGGMPPVEPGEYDLVLVWGGDDPRLAPAVPVPVEVLAG